MVRVGDGVAVGNEVGLVLALQWKVGVAVGVGVAVAVGTGVGVVVAVGVPTAPVWICVENKALHTIKWYSKSVDYRDSYINDKTGMDRLVSFFFFKPVWHNTLISGGFASSHLVLTQMGLLVVLYLLSLPNEQCDV